MLVCETVKSALSQFTRVVMCNEESHVSFCKCLCPRSSPEHSNYFGTDDKLGPVALSIRREKLDDTKDLKDQYQYRLIVRTSEVCTDLPFVVACLGMSEPCTSISVHAQFNSLATFILPSPPCVSLQVIRFTLSALILTFPPQPLTPSLVSASGKFHLPQPQQS